MKGSKVGRINALNGGDSFYSTTGQALGFYFVFSGKNATGETGTAEDLGRIIMERNGTQVDNINVADLQKIMNTRSGISILDSTTGDSFEGSAFVPFFEESFPTAMNITGSKELTIEWQEPGGGVINTRFDNLQVEVFMREAAIPENYIMGISSKTESYNGKIDTDPVPLGKKNVSTIFVDDQSGNLTQVSVDQDKVTEQDSVDPLYLRAVTLQENQIEDKSFEFPKLPLFTPGEADTLTSETTTVTLSVGSPGGNVKIIMDRIMFM